jgi:hypothetical protein
MKGMKGMGNMKKLQDDPLYPFYPCEFLNCFKLTAAKNFF